MASCNIMDTADRLEENIREFLRQHPLGGRFDLPDLGMDYLAIPVVMLTLDDEGWYGQYETENEKEWIDFHKRTPELLTFNQE